MPKTRPLCPKAGRADGMFTYGFSDWRLMIMNADGTMAAEFMLEETEDP